MYTNDYDDQFAKADKWMDSIQPYIKSEPLLHDADGIKPEQYGYAFREKASGAKVSSFKKPEVTVLIFDSNLLYRNAHSELWSVPQPGRHKSTDGSVAVDNLEFVDGHAKGFYSISATPSSGLSALQQALTTDDLATRSP